MNAMRRGLAGVLFACGFGSAMATTLHAGSDVESLLLEARALTRQMRFSAAEERLSLALSGGASAEQDAYGRLLLGLVAHERRDVGRAERLYREVIERSGVPATRAVAQSNLDMLSTERARYASYAPSRTKLDVWLAIECALALAVAGFVVRASR